MNPSGPAHRASGARGAAGAIGAAVIAAVPLLGACAGHGAPRTSTTVANATPQALAAVRAAVAKTAGSSATVQITLANPAGAPGTGTAGSVTARGPIDFVASRGTLVVTLPPTRGGGSTCATTTSQAPSRASGSGHGARQFPIAFLGNQVFVHPSVSLAPAKPSATTKPWILADFGDASTITSTFPAYILQVDAINPALAIAEISGGTVAAAVLGTSPGNGTSLTNYDVTVNLEPVSSGGQGPAAAAFAAAARAQIGAINGSPSVLGQLVPTYIIVSVGVDGHGFVSRIVLPTGSASSVTGASKDAVMTMTMSDHGTAVNVTAPAHDQVTDLAILGSNAERENIFCGDTDIG